MFFPHGDGKVPKEMVTLTNPNIVISALKRRNDGTFLIRLYNGNFVADNTELNMMGIKKMVHLKKFEFKTFVFDGKTITESEDSSIY